MGWITNSLPESCERVLVFMERDAWGENGHYRKKDIGIGWQFEGSWHVNGCMGEVVYAWMPLPKPPEESLHPIAP